MSTKVFYCGHCNKQFPWSSERAGQTVFCSCGNPVRVPRAPHGSAAPPVVASVAAPNEAAEPVATADLRDNPVIRYRTQPVEEEAANWRGSIRGSELRHLIIPVSFMVLALVVRFGLVFATNDPAGKSMIVQAGVAAGTMALNTLTLFIALAGVARFTGAELGPLPLTLIKLAAIGMLGSVIMGVAAMYEMQGHSAGIIALHVLALLYWVLFSLFFELDLQENLMAVAIAGLLQAGTMCILWQR